jgi:hypothetical protein
MGVAPDGVGGVQLEIAVTFFSKFAFALADDPELHAMH